MSKGKYDVILDNMSATESRLEILFRQAGDGFLQVEYGSEQRAALQDSFRMLAINDIILNKAINGLIETVPGIRTNLLHFDPGWIIRDSSTTSSIVGMDPSDSFTISISS